MGHVKLHSQTFKTIESRMQILLPLKLQSLSVRWTLRDVFYHLHAQSCTALCDPTAYAAQASLSLEFSRQGYWSRFLCLPPGDLPNAAIGASMYCLKRKREEWSWSLERLAGKLLPPLVQRVQVQGTRLFPSGFQCVCHLPPSDLRRKASVRGSEAKSEPEAKGIQEGAINSVGAGVR